RFVAVDVTDGSSHMQIKVIDVVQVGARPVRLEEALIGAIELFYPGAIQTDVEIRGKVKPTFVDQVGRQAEFDASVGSASNIIPLCRKTCVGRNRRLQQQIPRRIVVGIQASTNLSG